MYEFLNTENEEQRIEDAETEMIALDGIGEALTKAYGQGVQNMAQLIKSAFSLPACTYCQRTEENQMTSTQMEKILIDKFGPLGSLRDSEVGFVSRSTRETAEDVGGARPFEINCLGNQ